MNTLVQLFVEHPVAQAVGLVALTGTALSYQARTTARIAFWQAVSAFFWTVHLLLLGAWTGGLLNLLGMVRGAVYSQRGTRAWASRPFWPWLFAVLCVGAALWAGMAQGEGRRLLLCAVAQCAGCFALWISRVNLSRRLFVGISLLWLLYDALAGSIPGVVCEIFSQISLQLAMWRSRSQQP